MPETFYGQWDIYSLNSDGTNLSLGASPGALETSVGVDNSSSGGDTSTINSGTSGNTVDSAAQGGGSIDGDTFVGTITSAGGATVYVVTDGIGDYFGVVASGTNMSAGIASQPIPSNAVTWNMACFAAGTMIATPAGERAVETLAAGDLVLTAAGAAKPVRWLGRTTQTRLFADPARALPVRIAAGALGENLPVRDLLVSPGHAMLIEGVLVHAGALVNGSSITVERHGPESFTLYHVETDAHDLLVADGAVTESFLAGVEDLRFENWAERPAGLPVPAEMSYPRVKAGRQLPRAIRELIAARATAIAPDFAAAA
jgi:Hint domain